MLQLCRSVLLFVISLPHCTGKNIRQLDEQHVSPTNDHFLSIEKNKTYYWTKPLDKSIEVFFKSLLLDESSADLVKKSHLLNVIVGGDHGQQKFCCLMKLLLRDL